MNLTHRYVGHERGRRVAIAGIALACKLLIGCPSVLALDPALGVSQYAHTAWLNRQGFPKSLVEAFAQTPDGYLWLGTEFGLLRFDGFRALSWSPPAGQHLPGSEIRSLIATHDGTLWIGTPGGLASWKDGKLTQYPELAGKWIGPLLEARNGAVWAGAWSPGASRLCAVDSGNVRCSGEDGSFGSYPVSSLFEDSRSNFWVQTTTGVWRWRPDPRKFYPLPATQERIRGIAEGDNGSLLVATGRGIMRIADGKVEAYPLASTGPQLKPTQLLRDREGSLWVATSDHGVLHVHRGRTDAFAQSDGLSNDDVVTLFEDREGNIWGATYGGIDRFRDFAVPTISVKEGLSNVWAGSVLAAADGSVWLGTGDGLDRWNDGQITVYRKRGTQAPNGAANPEHGFAAVREVTDPGLPDDFIGSLFQDKSGRIWVSTPRGLAWFENDQFTPVRSLPAGRVGSIAESSVGGFWISYFDLGLFYLSREGVVEHFPWDRLGRKDFALTLLADSTKGGLWLGFWQGGLAYFKDGQILATYTATDGLGPGRINDLRSDPDGTLWAGTEGGLSRLKNGRVDTLGRRNGLPCDSVHWTMEDDAHSLWVYMACGLVRVARSELDAWVSNPKGTMQTTVFDGFDGVRSHANAVGYSPRVAKSTDGKLWFTPWDGVSFIDPRHLAFDNLPPPVHIEQIRADHKTYDTSSDANRHLHLPPLVRDLEIEYTALSLVAPEKNQFRYKLEGRDRDWESVGNRRQAFYNDLPPGNYRFRVAASNYSGVWNEQGAALDFSIAPAYWQTNWFRALCVAAFLLVLWALYQLRLRQIAQAFNARLEERVAERTRIARELHDTLLQSFQGLLLRFHTVRKLLRVRPAEAEKILESAIDQTAQAITDSRTAVQGLRASSLERNDLAVAIRTLGEQLAAEVSSHARVELQVDVEGAPRALHPIVRDEIYRIAGEALRNAFRHAAAKQIEVELRYAERQLRLRIRDDGKGIEPLILAAEAPAGHFGLQGMRERAKLIRGELTVWTAPGSGTEIELSVPAVYAYVAPSAAQRSWFSKKLAGLASRPGHERQSESDLDV